MVDYYEVLGVRPTASLQGIKKSFRKKVKEQHPDLRKTAEDSQRNIRLLIQAYKVLSNPESRAQYDRSHHFLRRAEERFDYREFLKNRTDDLDSQAKLIFFDLLHDRSADAAELYERLTRESGFAIEEHLDREDFMDCAYLLSEIYEERGELDRAFELLRRIAELELEKPYFKHFFYEVTRRLQSIVCLKMRGAQALDSLLGLSELSLPKRFVAALFLRAAEIYLGMNNPGYASSYLDRALALERRVAGAAKLKAKLTRFEESLSLP